MSPSFAVAAGEHEAIVPLRPGLARVVALRPGDVGDDEAQARAYGQRENGAAPGTRIRHALSWLVAEESSRGPPAVKTRWALASEPARLVDHVAQGLAGQEAPAIVEQDLEAALVEIRPVAGGVRGDEDAGHRPQRVAGRERLVLEHVEAGPGDLARPQGLTGDSVP